MPFPTDPYWTPHTIHRNALAENANGHSSGFWTAGGGRSVAFGGNWELEEGSFLYSTHSRLCHPWRGPMTYDIGYDTTNVALTANDLNFYILSDVNVGDPLNVTANAYFRVQIKRNGRHDVYYKRGGGSATVIATSGAAVANAVRTRITISPDKYTVGEKTFAQHVKIEVMTATGQVNYTQTVTEITATFDDDWQVWRASPFTYLDQKRQQAQILFRVADSGGVEYWIINHFAILNELDSGITDYVFDPIPDGPEFELPNFDPVEQPYMDWGYLDPAGEPFNCAINGTGNQSAQLERCINWARDYSMGVLLSDGYNIRINRKIEMWQWCHQRTSKGADRDFLVDEFRPPCIHGRFTTTKPKISVTPGSLTGGSDIKLFESNTLNYEADPSPTFPANWPDTQRIINTRGTWTNTTVYAIGDKVALTGTDYLCTFPHTAATANDQPGTGTNWPRFWEIYDPPDSGYPSSGRPNAVYNHSFYNFVIDMTTGNTAGIGLDARGAQGTECILVDVIGSGYESGFGDLPGSGGAITSCSATGGKHAIKSQDSQPGTTISAFLAHDQSLAPFYFLGGSNRTVCTLVGCKVTGLAAGQPGVDNNGADDAGAGFSQGNVVVRDCSFEWDSYAVGNKCVVSDRAVVMKNVFAYLANSFATVDNSTTGASPAFTQTLASGNISGWSHLEEAVFPANPPVQTGGNLATLRTNQAATNNTIGGTVVQTPTPLQYQWSIIFNLAAPSGTLRSFVGANIAPPADLLEHHKISDASWLTIDDVTIDAVVDLSANRFGFTNNATLLNTAAAAAPVGSVIGFRSGMFLINDSFNVPSGVHVFTPLKQRGFLRPAIAPTGTTPFGPSDPDRRPILRTQAGLNTSVVANMGFFFTPNTPTGFSASFECPTICYGSHMMRRSGEGYGSLPGYPNTVEHIEPLVQFYGPTGMGQMYTGNEGNAYNTKAGYAHFAVIDTATAIGVGLVEFYSLDAEHVETWPGNVFLSNFDRVKIYSLKGEANLPIMTAINGKMLELWGPGGNGTPYIHDSISTTGWIPLSDPDNTCGYVPKPAGAGFPVGVPSAGVTLCNPGSYMIGMMQDVGRYQNNDPPVFGWGTRPDGTKILNIVSAFDGTGTESYATALYQRPAFIANTNYDKPNLYNRQATAITGTTMIPVTDTDKSSGILYMVVCPDNDTPTVAQIKLGQQSNGTPAIAASNLTAPVAGTNTFPQVTGLTQATNYELHFVHTDAALANSTRRGLGFTTLAGDVTAPVLTAPTVTAIGQTSVSPRVTTDTAEGILYMVLVPDGDVPSVAQIKAGQRSNGTAAIGADNDPISAAGVYTFAPVNALAENTLYDIWYVHTDVVGNNSTAVMAGFQTSSIGPILSSAETAAVTTNSVTPRVTTNEGNGTVYCVVVPNGNNPSAAQIKLGLQANSTPALGAGNLPVTVVGVYTFSVMAGLIADTTYTIRFVHTDAVGNDSNIGTCNFVTLNLAPTISALTYTVIGAATVQASFSTTDNNGTVYQVVVPDANVPSVAQIKAGQQANGSAAISAGNQPITAAGTQVLAQRAGLVASTPYELAVVHTDAGGLDSNILTSGFSTQALSGGGTGRAFLMEFDVSREEAAGREIPVAMLPQVTSQVITFSGGATAFAPIGPKTTYVRLQVDMKGHFAMNAIPNGDSPYLVADFPEYFGVKPGDVLRVGDGT